MPVIRVFNRCLPGRSTTLALLLIVLSQLIGCASFRTPESEPYAPAFEPVNEDSLLAIATAAADTVPIVLPDWPEAPAGQASPADWEECYQQAFAAIAAGDDHAHDILFALQDMTTGAEPADADTLYLQHRRSMQRRLVLLGGLLAEQTAYAGDAVAADSVLTAEYLGLQGFSFPDSLIPATGTTLPALQADLLKVQHGKIDRWIDYFTGRGRRHFQTWLDRKNAVETVITTILDDEGLPRELIYLAMIESGLSTRARSSVGAVGPWQFMPGTARAYGLEQSWWVDERRDLVKATRAASQYLRDLHDEFGDWALVLAAYNSGEGRVRRQLRLNGHDNYWDYRLPRQTVEYVPKFIAAARIGADPAAYGFENKPAPALVWDDVAVDDATDLGLVAKCAGVAEDAVVRLNPALLRRATPPGSKKFSVRVPAGTAVVARRALRKVPADKRLTWRKHEVRRGETLSHIAARWGTSVRAVQEANSLGRGTMIHPGDQLLIPMPRDLSAQARLRAERAGRYVPPKGYERVTYKVRKGDTLGSIARRLGVSVTHLKRVNKIKDPRKIQIGQTIAAYRPPSHTG